MKCVKIINLIVFFVFGVCFSLFAEEFAEENLALNGDFEDLYLELPVHWTKEAWQTSEAITKYYSESDNPQSGNFYVTIENIQNNDARLVQEVVVKPFTYYRLSCWVKVERCGMNKLGANLSVMHPNLLETSKDLKDTGGEWEYLEYYVRTGAKQENMKIAVRLGGFGNDNVGKVSFDNFRLEEITDATGISAVDISRDDGIGTQVESSIDASMIFIAAAIFILVCIGGLLLYILIIKPRLDKGETSKTALTESLRAKSGGVGSTRKDWILAGSLTLIYAIIALTNLGSLKAPQTYWQPISRGEDVVADLGEVQTIRRVYYFQGLPGGHGPDAKYEVDYSVDGINWTHIATLGPDTIYYWYYKSTNVKARYMKITVEKPRSWLNEIVFTGEDIKKPLPIVNVYSQSGTNPLSKGDINNLFDEQDTFASRPSHFTGMSPGFDEQYHARTAMEHIVFDDPYEDTHPPLGKLLMAVGILIFGMTPFGWRFMGTFLGILMIPIMYAFGKDMFKKSEYAFLTSLLFAVDFMHFTQTRIATIDSYGVFFIILMYFFMYKHYKMSFFTTDFKKTLIPLFLAGVCFGLGCASKWIAVYSVAGLLVLGIVSIVKKGFEYGEMKRKLFSKTLKRDKEEWKRIKEIIDKYPRYLSITGVLAICVCFVIVPVLLYFLSFVPLWFVPAISESPRNPTIFHWVLETVNGMIDYHTNVTQEHSFSSHWYEWPLMIRPMWYHVSHGLPAGQTQRLFAFGNPAIWWIGSFLAIPLGIILSLVGRIKRFGFYQFFLQILSFIGICFAFSIIILIFYLLFLLFGFIGKIFGITFMENIMLVIWIISVPFLIYFIIRVFTLWCTHKSSNGVIKRFMTKSRHKNDALFAIIIGFASQYIFWIISPRKLTFIYHYFACVPFLVLCLVALIKYAKENLIPKINKENIMGKFLFYTANGAIYAYILFAIVLFIMFYPIIAGVPFDMKYIQTFLKWFDTWYFA